MRARARWSSAPPPSSRRRRAETSEGSDPGLPRPRHLAQALELGARDGAFRQVVRVARRDEPQACPRVRKLAAQDVPLGDVEMRLEMLLRPTRGDLDRLLRR